MCVPVAPRKDDFPSEKSAIMSSIGTLASAVEVHFSPIGRRCNSECAYVRDGRFGCTFRRALGFVGCQGQGVELVRSTYGHPDAVLARKRVREAFRQAPAAPVPLRAAAS